MALHSNPIQPGEDEARADLYAEFEAALDELIANARAEADEIGGTFRGPGIRVVLNGILRGKKV